MRDALFRSERKHSMVYKTNIMIRRYIFEHGLRVFEICHALDVSESSFYRMMRKDHPAEYQTYIIGKLKGCEEDD